MREGQQVPFMGNQFHGVLTPEMLATIESEFTQSNNVDNKLTSCDVRIFTHVPLGLCASTQVDHFVELNMLDIESNKRSHPLGPLD